MGADGGIVGIAVKDPNSREAMARIHELVPHPFLFWDDYRDDEAMEAAMRDAPDGYVWSTYGSFQDWSLMELPGAVEEAADYAKIYPDATFRDWIENLATYPSHGSYEWCDWHMCGDMSGFLMDHYLGVHNPYNAAGLANAPEPRYPAYYKDPLPDMKIADWVRELGEILCLDERPWSEETWT